MMVKHRLHRRRMKRKLRSSFRPRPRLLLIPAGILLIIAAIFFFSSCRITASPDSFHTVLDELFLQEVSSNTLTMHYSLRDPSSAGIGSYTVTLGDYSEKARTRSASELKKLHRTLNKYKKSSLSGEDALTYEVLCDYVDTRLSLSEYEYFEEPLLPSGGIASQLPLLLAEYSFDRAQDVNDYLALLSQIDTYFSQILDYEQEKAKAGLFLSDSQCQDTIVGLEKFIADTKDHYLISTFNSKIEQMELSDTQKNAYISENESILTDTVFPAYESLIEGLTALMGCGRNSLGLYYYEDGKEYYALSVYAQTGCSDSMDDLFERIAAARAADLAACSNLLAANPSLAQTYNSYDWPYENDSEMLDALSNAMLADFPAPPDITCEICYVDPSMEAYLAPAFYITAPLDDYLNNSIYINSAAGYSDLSYFTTLAHESLPGHLYQTVMSYEYGLEPIRCLLDYPGYTEGWATYVEMRSYSYADIPEDIAQLLMHNQSATLSLYASSDIGLHYYGWTLEQLTQFWSEYGISDPASIKLIAGLILADPGNYLKYYVGYLEFLTLHQNMQEKYGDAFSETAFHEALLRMGPAPFDLLEKYFDDFYSPES